MVELVRKMPTTLREFMDRVDDFINAEDMLKLLIDPNKGVASLIWLDFVYFLESNWYTPVLRI